MRFSQYISHKLTTQRPIVRGIAALFCSFSIGCENAELPETISTQIAEQALGESGPYGSGVRTFELIDETRARPVTYEVWYPIPKATSSTASKFSDFMTTDQFRQWEDWKTSNSNCTVESVTSIRDAEIVRDGQWPLVLYSHCHNCTRFSNATMLEHLASWGAVVIAPDHTGNSLFDENGSDSDLLSYDTLNLRIEDLRYAFDNLASFDLGGAWEIGNTSVIGHSFGAVTVGGFANRYPDDVSTLTAIAAPIENLLFAGATTAEELTIPSLYVVAEEDNSIGAVGNNTIDNNWQDSPSPSYKVIVQDAGHWSFSTIAGVIEDFDPGCGTDDRMTNGQPFEYVPVRDASAVAKQATTAFLLDSGVLYSNLGTASVLSIASDTVAVSKK